MGHTVVDEQSDSRRFSVVKVPILGIVLESFVLPFRHIREILKYGWIPLVGSLVARLLVWLIVLEFSASTMALLTIGISRFVLFTPFAVVWSTIAIEGTRAKLPTRPFAFEATEWGYLLATMLMMIAVALLIGIPLTIYEYGQQNFNGFVTFGGGLLLVAGALAVIFGYIRLAFVFPAIAIGHYEGIGAAWRQTKGNFEPLASVILVTVLPFFLFERLIRLSVGYQTSGVSAMATASLQMFVAAWATTASVAAPALTYKAIVQPDPTDGANATTIATR